MNKRVEKLTTVLASATVMSLGAAACTTHGTHASEHPTALSTLGPSSTPDKGNIFPSASATETSSYNTDRMVAIARRIATLSKSNIKGIHMIPEEAKPAFTSGFEYVQSDNNIIFTATEQTSQSGDPESVVAVMITEKQNGVIYFEESFFKTNTGTWNAYVSTQAKSGDMVTTEEVIGGESVLNIDITMPQGVESSHDPIQVAQAFETLVTQVDKQLAPIAGL